VHRDSDAYARSLVAGFARVALTLIGGSIAVLGVVIAPLPGPMGLPVVVLGIMIMLRGSFKAKRQFIRFQHAYPRLVSPVRRLLRRDPEVLKIFWQQYLRVERTVLPRPWRFAARTRIQVRGLFRRRPKVV